MAGEEHQCISPFYIVGLNDFRIIIEVEAESTLSVLELKREIQAGNLDSLDLKNAKLTIQRIIKCPHDFSKVFQEKGATDDKKYKVCKHCGAPEPDE